MSVILNTRVKPFQQLPAEPLSFVSVAAVPLLHDQPVDVTTGRLVGLQCGIVGAQKILMRSTPLLTSVQKIFHFAGLTPPEAVPIFNPRTGAPANWSTTTESIVDFMIAQANRQTSLKQIDEAQHQNEKILNLLMIALRMGNIDLAMLLFASLENRQAAEMTRLLTQKLVEAQENRRKLTGQMASDGKDSQKNLAQTQANVQEVNDTIQMLTTFIRDVNDQKNRTMEFANNFLSNEHQTTMSIVRGMKG